MILVPGRNCIATTPVRESGLLVDAEDYYRAFHRSALLAERYIVLTGWQFDSNVCLLRGDEARKSEAPVELRAFLTYLCQRRPELRIYMLAWDYSVVYALEREWLQSLIFDWTTPKGITFRFDDQHASGASHHRKLVVIDGRVGFAGGMDFANNRWDDRGHTPENPRREAKRPYHDIAGYLTGPAVEVMQDLFVEAWARATGELLELDPWKPSAPLEFPGALRIDCPEVALSRTEASFGEGPLVEELRTLWEDSVRTAERLVYVESQYFTSRVVHDTLVARMRDRSRPPLQVVVMLPRCGDTPKESLVLGDAQEEVLSSLSAVADETGSRFRVYCSIATDEQRGEVPTFIHSKCFAVDDRLFSVGSANLTNRSFSLDSELNITWECGKGGADIARARASLLAEHAGVPEHEVSGIEGLVERLDALAAQSRSKLRRRPIQTGAPGDVERTLRLERIFDPAKPLSDVELDEVVHGWT
jgi:phospholipase D1/2